MGASFFTEPQDLVQSVVSERERGESLVSIRYFSLFACLALTLVLIVCYAVLIKPLVMLPADILMWEEGNFVGDIIKLRIGAPLYTTPSDNNSLIYTPLSPVLTYLISRVFNLSTSIVGWRFIQIGFVVCAALIATRCSWSLRRLADPDYRVGFPKTWMAFTFCALFLTATAPEVNRFVHTLHVDALALLISVISFWTMLRYLRKPSTAGIVLMAVCPALGYLTKQFLISWAVVMFVFLVFHNYRDIKRIILFCVLAAGLIGLAMGGCYLLWGDPYIFWTFKVMGARKSLALSPASPGISVMRMFDHMLRSWLEISTGLVGGFLVLTKRRHVMRLLGPLWVAWLALMLSEIFSSGAGWDTVYHFGPGVLIGMTWLIAGLQLYWPKPSDVNTTTEFPRLTYWAKTAIAVISVVTIMIGLGVVPTGKRTSARYWGRTAPVPDVTRYLADIESEFNGLPRDKVLLDIGNWVYLPESVLQKDRAVSVADQPPVGNYENIDLIVQHIRQQTYQKILVHDLDSPFFIYDWHDWPRPSGVRQALRESYKEVRTIPALEGRELFPESAFTGPITVLVPR